MYKKNSGRFSSIYNHHPAIDIIGRMVFGKRMPVASKAIAGVRHKRKISISRAFVIRYFMVVFCWQQVNIFLVAAVAKINIYYRGFKVTIVLLCSYRLRYKNEHGKKTKKYCKAYIIFFHDRFFYYSECIAKRYIQK